jgi:hypothetical protein
MSLAVVNSHRADRIWNRPATRLAQTSPASWDVFFDVGAFAGAALRVVDEVRTELAALAADDTRPGPKPALAGAATSKVGSWAARRGLSGQRRAAWDHSSMRQYTLLIQIVAP